MVPRSSAVRARLLSRKLSMRGAGLLLLVVVVIILTDFPNRVWKQQC